MKENERKMLTSILVNATNSRFSTIQNHLPKSVTFPYCQISFLRKFVSVIRHFTVNLLLGVWGDKTVEQLTIITIIASFIIFGNF